MEYINDLVAYFKLHPYFSTTMLVVFVIVLILLYLYRGTKQVVYIVGNAIIEVEKECNTEKGQQKLDMAVLKVKERLPKVLSIFMTKFILVSIIEFMLNIVGKAFNIDRKVDIKGNDD